MKALVASLALAVALAMPALADDDKDKLTAASASQRVLIIGGAGHAGSAVARMLIERGDHVTAFVRATTDRSKLEGVPVDYVVGDAMEADEVAAALEGKQFDVFFETVQVWPGTEASYTQMYENFVPWARRMGVNQFISIGGGCGENPREDCPSESAAV